MMASNITINIDKLWRMVMVRQDVLSVSQFHHASYDVQ